MINVEYIDLLFFRLKINIFALENTAIIFPEFLSLKFWRIIWETKDF